jgi:pyridinium-3,5-bisthiocarboxylic acid mononucleotide nickel chelatase
VKTLYFDAFCGASGDMIVGALLDAGADFDTLKAGLDTLGVEGYTVRAERVDKHGIMATKFHVDVDESHGHPHRHLRHILEIIESGDLPQPVKDASAETFRRIAECEAAIHGTTIEKIHFHEVGAVDSIADVVGAHLALHLLDIEHIESSPLHIGSGTVKCAHGVMPVPAPATAKLLENVPVYGGEVAGELVTPTGAALVSQLAGRFGPLPAMRITASGYGSGTRNLPDRPNVLRVVLGEIDAALPATEPIVVIETNIDDMNPELIPPLLSDALDRGARDAFVTPILGKKGRPAQLITVLCDPDTVSVIVETLFKGSTTLGVRMREERRICLPREWRSVRTPWGGVRVKIGALGDSTNSASPEFDDCRRVAEEAGESVKAVYSAALAAAARGDWDDA